MPRRRILSVWLPRLSAERALRRPDLAHVGLDRDGAPFAVTAEEASAVRVLSVNAAAAAQGLSPGMTLADARARQPALVSVPHDPGAEARFRAGLLRWSRRWSPWTTLEHPAEAFSGRGEGGLALDITGCAHLHGGEAPMAEAMHADLAALGLTARIGLADTRGAAWALARHGAPQGMGAAPALRSAHDRTGDAIQVDAYATRVRTPARDRSRAEAPFAAPSTASVSIASPGGARAALADLPPEALRLAPDVAAGLARLGLRRIGDLAGMPRAALARRFGSGLVLRLDQALGAAPEPISPAAPEPVFAVRLTLPEPIGLRADLEAALGRLLDRLCARLEAEDRGARRLRLAVRRVDGEAQAREVGLARPARDPARLAPLFDRALEEIDAGFGIDAVRLEATVVELLAARQHAGHFEARAEAAARQAPGGGDAFADLLGRLGARIGLERLARLQPADSHLPEKAAVLAAAAYSEATEHWPAAPAPRPLVMLEPEPCTPLASGRPPRRFRWRRAEHEVAAAAGPERISPEWWLDDPAWRGGARDYWRVETRAGARLWLFETRGGPDAEPGWEGRWSVHGIFA
ncbi:MAG: DNA polymerase Y family protein [Pseudomonadota bacterium]